MIDFYEIFTNKIVLTILITLVFTQIAKFFTYRFSNGKFDWVKLVDTGGMPSSHSAIVSSLTFSIFLIEGFGTLFIIAVVFSTIVVRDAMGLRRQAGEQAKILNKIVDDLKIKGKLAPARLKEIIGHTPLQVFIGVLLGLIIAVVIWLI